jgi:hypothetical protein
MKEPESETLNDNNIEDIEVNIETKEYKTRYRTDAFISIITTTL